MPWKTTGYQEVFGHRTATTSPLRSPFSCRAAASRSTWWASWPWVITSPETPPISAGASGRSLPAARTNSGTEMSGISTSGYGLARATADSFVSAEVAPVSHSRRGSPHRGYWLVQRGQSTDCVQRNSAIVLPLAELLTTASQTCVVRPAWMLVATTSIRPSRAVLRWLLLSSIVVNPLDPSGSKARVGSPQL